MTGYDRWVNEQFSETERGDYFLAGPNADPDNDGRLNLLEYAFDSDPQSENHTPLISLEDGVASFVRNTLKEDLTYVLEASSDLSSWSEMETSASDLGDGLEQVSQTFSDSKMFFRVRVDQGGDQTLN